MSTDNPYQDQTDANTSLTWLGDQKKVDLDLDGIREYAANMVTVKENLSSHTGYLDLLGQLPTDAWEGGVLGEGAYMRQQMMNNYGELRQYLAHLSTALDNIGMAARTVADLFSSTDGWSAADINAVNWAFGDKSATRPDNVPSYIGDTYWDKYFEAMNDPEGAPPADSGAWVDQGQTVGPGGMVTQTAIGPNGQIKKIVTSTPPGGGAITVTTTIYNARGEVVSTSSSRTSTYLDGNTVVTRTVTTDGSGQTTGTKEDRTTYSDGTVVAESSESRNADGDVTSSTTTRTNDDGTQTTTATSGDGPARTTTTGPQTPGVTGVPDSPTQQALEDIQGHDYGPRG
ncbi:MAG TPA: hypothetical protein VFR67_02230 [Pilimelia sp.]|nr:hypothetical protein [Pilimelia sp.]